MEFSTYSQTYALNNFESTKSLENIRKMQKTRLPKSGIKTTDEEMNPFLDIPIRTFIDDFVLTWHKILMKLLDNNLYKLSNEQMKLEWWDRLFIIIIKILNEFWQKERILYVGLGLVIASFFFFFIFVTY
tara:strand:+ start:365 stop:754 length:390 start_codon:yes stop_codon:yes gene_type:complete